jgi:hypothetical protein
VGALVVGYKTFAKWDERRESLTRRVRSLLRRTSPSHRA